MLIDCYECGKKIDCDHDCADEFAPDCENCIQEHFPRVIAMSDAVLDGGIHFAEVDGVFVKIHSRRNVEGDLILEFDKADATLQGLMLG